MKLRFFMTNGCTIEVDAAEDFNFPVMCMSIRAAGYFMSGNIYIDHFKINAMAYGDQGAEIKMPEGQRLQ